MSEPFAKLFDTPHGQFLAMTDTVDDEEVIVLRGAPRRGVLPAMTLSGYRTDEDRDAEFAKIDQARADESAAGFANMIEGLLNEEVA